MNAVRALEILLQSFRPDWRIHCIGPVTAAALVRMFGKEKVVSVASYGSELASQLIEKYDQKDFVFFCGDKRLETIPELMAKYGRKVQEIVLYKNSRLSHRIDSDYDAAVFFSPSAVEAFFQSNPDTAMNRFFSIGKTTTAKISEFREAEIIEPEETSQESMVKRIISYYSLFA